MHDSASFQLPEGEKEGKKRRREEKTGLHILYGMGSFMRSTTGAPSVSNRIQEAGTTIGILTCPRN